MPSTIRKVSYVTAARPADSSMGLGRPGDTGAHQNES